VCEFHLLIFPIAVLLFTSLLLFDAHVLDALQACVSYNSFTFLLFFQAHVLELFNLVFLLFFSVMFLLLFQVAFLLFFVIIFLLLQAHILIAPSLQQNLVVLIGHVLVVSSL
jgi:hypothetical protein